MKAEDFDITGLLRPPSPIHFSPSIGRNNRFIIKRGDPKYYYKDLLTQLDLESVISGGNLG
jgi:hypothetical protein